MFKEVRDLTVREEASACEHETTGAAGEKGSAGRT